MEKQLMLEPVWCLVEEKQNYPTFNLDAVLGGKQVKIPCPACPDQTIWISRVETQQGPRVLFQCHHCGVKFINPPVE